MGILRACLNKSVDEAFRPNTIGSQFNADIAIDNISLRISAGAAADDDDCFNNVEDVVDLPADPKVIELLLAFSSRPLLMKPFFLVYFFFNIVA